MREFPKDMEKQILEKIYKLKKIKPDKEWKENVLQNILDQDSFSVSEEKRTESVFSVFQRKVNVFSMANAFALVLLFAIFALPLFYETVPEYEVRELPYLAETETEKEETKVAENDDPSREVAKEEQPVKQQFSSLEESYREIQVMVLATQFGVEENEEEIAQYAIEEMEKEMQEEAVEELIFIMQENSTEKETEKEYLKKAKKAMEEEDYYQVLDIYLNYYTE